MQQAGQVPHLDQNDAHEQSLGQSDGSLPGPEQTLNQSINQSYRKAVASEQHLAGEDDIPKSTRSSAMLPALRWQGPVGFANNALER